MRAILIFTALTAALCMAATKPGEPLPNQVATIALEGVKERIDHMAVDATGQRLYVAALGNNTVEVIDLAQGTRIGQINGLKTPQGVCVLPGSGNLIVASGGDGKCRMYDSSQKLLGTIDGLDDADNVRYDPEAKLIYVGYADGALAVIDAEKFTKVADIKLEGHPESFQLEAKGKRIFVNVPTAGHIAVIDREKRAVTSKWPIKDAKANFPMALDEASHRLFVGCRRPAKLLVLDSETGKVVATLDCCGDTDDVFHDADAKRLYVTGGEGCVSVIEQTDADHYPFLGKVTTAAGARTALFVPSLNRLFVAVPDRGQQKAELRVFETRPISK